MSEIERLQEAVDRMMIGGNHIATYRSARWPDYPLDGLTRDQQCEHALRMLGAGRDYDMWCCWSAMMQVRDDLGTTAPTSANSEGNLRVAVLKFLDGRMAQFTDSRFVDDDLVELAAVVDGISPPTAKAG